MLQTLLAYVRGAGIDARWLVIEGDPSFFAITKRIHNGLYGLPGDGGELGAAERRHSPAGVANASVPTTEGPATNYEARPGPNPDVSGHPA